MNPSRWIGRCAGALVVLPFCAGLASAAQYTFSVEPSYPPEQAVEVYEPLLNYLKKETGHQFKVQAVRNYHFYWRDLRQAAQTDFAFEEAHFADYRIKRSGFIPLAHRVEPSVYVLMAAVDFADGGTAGLVGRRIVSMPSPSLGFAEVAQMYRNPIAQPEIRSEATTWRDGVELVFSGDAEGAMVPAFVAEQYPNLVEIARSDELTGAAVTAAPSVPEDVQQAVKDALLKLSEDPDAFVILAELGATGFVEASAEDFDGAESRLSAFFGYRPPAEAAAEDAAAAAAAAAEAAAEDASDDMGEEAADAPAE